VSFRGAGVLERGAPCADTGSAKETMGDGAEGLIDAQSKIQDRLDELEELRTRRFRVVRNPDREQRLQSLGLARVELLRQSDVSTHPVRRQQLALAIAELDRRIAELTAEK
jgi:hypothetical protein